MRLPFGLLLFSPALGLGLGCGGATASDPTPAPASQPAPSRDGGDGGGGPTGATPPPTPRPLEAGSCSEAGCTPGFTCAACPSGKVCDDALGAARCVTVETLVGCGAGTEFCNSACGVCQLPGSRCVKDTCDGSVARCGAGAWCGRGTRCVDDVCVLE